MHFFVARLLLIASNNWNLRPSRSKPTPDEPADLLHTQWINSATQRQQVCQRTVPLSFDASFPENRRKYPHEPDIARNWQDIYFET